MYTTKRGDVYFADLNPVVGSEQGGDIRPVLIIQNNKGNKFSPTLIIAPITNRAKAKIPTHVKLDNIEFLREDSIILLEQIKTIDRSRLKEYIGRLDNLTMSRVNNALSISVGLQENKRILKQC